MIGPVCEEVECVIGVEERSGFAVDLVAGSEEGGGWGVLVGSMRGDD